MLLDEHTIIDRRSTARPARPIGLAVWALALLLGTGAAIFYGARGLTLSHYDARAHLVVARRVGDSLTPGWRQFGAVWLPLPHVLNVVPVQVDTNYRTGTSAVAISILALSIGLGAFAAFLYRRSQSSAVAAAFPLAILANPNVLYLQSTPMTEPLLLGLALAAVDAVDRWARAPDARHRRLAGTLLVLLVLTRYEGWPIAAALLAAALLIRVRAALRLAIYPGAAIAAFLLLSFAATGVWFVSSGFFVPDNPSAHQALLVLDDMIESTRDLGGSLLLWSGAAGVVACLALGWRRRADLLPLALLAAGGLPFAAFYAGHPHRVRYMVPIVVALIAVSGLLVARLPRLARAPAALLLLSLFVWTQPPLRADAAMVLEAQWETPWRLERERVTAALAPIYDGTPILASMGSLGHYMHETSSAGLPLRSFLHEGNGDLWTDALRWPERHVRWILIEERAEGGDLIAARARADATFLASFERVIEAGGLALYRRRE
jgi:hypothetical protein